jgi:hypothetical protein
MQDFWLILNRVTDLGLLIVLGVAICQLRKPRAVTIYFKRIEGVEKVETDA